MATKVSKKTTVTQSSSATTSGTGSRSNTPQQQSTRPQSPGLSPTRFSRLQEKADLQNLNDRLATYIDRVRQLESENSGLRREIQTVHETITRESTTLKSMYEKELGEARTLLDLTARDKAKLEIDNKRISEENGDLTTRLAKKTKELIVAERQLQHLEPQVADLTTKHNKAVSDRKKAEDRVKELEHELEKLRKQCAELRKFLEAETLLRVDLENNLQSKKEELNFKEQIHKNELTETRTRKQVEVSEIDGRLTEAYEAKLQQSLQELRDQYEAQMRINRDEIEALYDTKLRNAQNQANRSSGAHSQLLEESRQYRSQIDLISSKLAEAEMNNSGLLARIQDLEKLMQAERDSNYNQRQLLEQELRSLQDEMEKQLQEYQDLMDIRVALDLEIAAYRKLLESEEARLNISPMQSPAVRGTRGTPQRRTPVNVRKRKRFEDSSSSSMSEFITNKQESGDLEISEVCPEGMFVRLRNKGEKEISLSGCQLLRKAGDNEASYKFHRTSKLEGGASLTVWSSESKQSHEPPSNLLMKGQKWVVGNDMTTVLKNNAGEELALHERHLQQMSQARMREVSGYGGEELYHQQGDPQGGEDRCSVM